MGLSNRIQKERRGWGGEYPYTKGKKPQGESFWSFQFLTPEPGQTRIAFSEEGVLKGIRSNRRKRDTYREASLAATSLKRGSVEGRGNEKAR